MMRACLIHSEQRARSVQTPTSSQCEEQTCVKTRPGSIHQNGAPDRGIRSSDHAAVARGTRAMLQAPAPAAYVAATQPVPDPPAEEEDLLVRTEIWHQKGGMPAEPVQAALQPTSPAAAPTPVAALPQSRDADDASPLLVDAATPCPGGASASSCQHFDARKAVLSSAALHSEFYCPITCAYSCCWRWVKKTKNSVRSPLCRAAIAHHPARKKVLRVPGSSFACSITFLFD